MIDVDMSKSGPLVPLLFEVEFGLSEQVRETQRAASSSADMTTLMDKRNKLSVSNPEVFNLSDLLIEKGAEIPAELRLQLNLYDFYHVRFACTFKPDRGCKFTWARFGMCLSVADDKTEAECETPIAYDMFPKEVFEEIKVTKKLTFGPSLKYGELAELQAGAHKESGFTKYEPEIMSFGLLQAEPCWDFKATTGKSSIVGDKELYMVIRSLQGTKIDVAFRFGAEIETFLGLLPMIPVSIYRDEAVVESRWRIG